MDTSKVTRVEIIEDGGRSLVEYGVAVELQLQDNDRTLKIFLDKLPPEEAAKLYPHNVEPFNLDAVTDLLEEKANDTKNSEPLAAQFPELNSLQVAEMRVKLKKEGKMK